MFIVDKLLVTMKRSNMPLEKIYAWLRDLCNTATCRPDRADVS